MPPRHTQLSAEGRGPATHMHSARNQCKDGLVLSPLYSREPGVSLAQSCPVEGLQLLQLVAGGLKKIFA